MGKTRISPVFSNNKGLKSKIFKGQFFYLYLKFSSGLIAKVTANGSCSMTIFMKLKFLKTKL